MTGGTKPIRLPPLKTLRVHDPKRAVEKPCFAIMSTVLGYNAAGCAALENQLRQCMDGPKPPSAGTNTVNYHLARFKNQVISRGKNK